MRILGLDLGEKRIGIAVSDETGAIASPYATYERRSPIADPGYIVNLARELRAERIIVGLPLNMDGTEGAEAAKARAFAWELACHGLPVELFDERLTTVEARSVLAQAGFPERGKRKIQDKLAATIILQAWLDRNSK